MRSLQFWCGFTAAQYAIPACLAAEEADWNRRLKAMARLGPERRLRRDAAALEQRLIAIAPPLWNWSLTSLKDKLIKIGAKVVSHGRSVIFQMAEVAIAAKQSLQTETR